jgi:hypothetical protein
MRETYTTGYSRGMGVDEAIRELAEGDRVRVNDQKQWLTVTGRWGPLDASPHPLLVNDGGKYYALNDMGLSATFVRLDDNLEKTSDLKVKELTVDWR